MYTADSFRLENQVAVITGAGAGIGRAIAETFAAAGASVVVSDRDLVAAEAVAKGIQSSGGKAAAIACDVTQENDLTGLVAGTVQQFGKLTILVSNAGGGGPKPFDMPMEDFRRAYDLNVFSLFRLAQIAAPEMEKAGGGAVLAITSMAGENKNKRMAHTDHLKLPLITSFVTSPLILAPKAFESMALLQVPLAPMHLSRF